MIRSACCRRRRSRAQLVLLAVPQARRVELTHLKAEEVLALRAVALGRAQPLDLLARGPMLGVQDAATRLAQLLDVREAVEELELARRARARRWCSC